MGLPLYQAPAESDAETKPATDRAAQSRSPIRRTTYRRGPSSARDRRRRVLTATATATANSTIGDSLVYGDNPSDWLVDPIVTSTNGDSLVYGDNHVSWMSHGPGALPPMDMGPSVSRAIVPPIPLVGSMDRATFLRYYMNQDAGRESALSQTPAQAPTENDGPGRLREQRRGARPSASTAEPTYAISNLRSTQSQSSSSQPAVAGVSLYSLDPQTLRHYRALQTANNERTSRVGTTQVDGLGDRNRSLSPEVDHMWDNLLSSITPDPQPPSVGSSFASNSASLAASSTNSASLAASSSDANPALSSTSLAAPQNVVEQAPEPPCEPDCDVSDTEGDEDDVPHLSPLRRFPGTLRSYAEAAGGGSNTAEDAPESLDDMLRIVRHLARREDIPDEWWAEVGLSRTLSRSDAAV